MVPVDNFGRGAMKAAKEVVLSREELHRRVWERPMRDVATELGISDVGLKKLCRRNGIPTPPRGYHLMNQGVQKAKAAVALPPRGPHQPEQLRFRIPTEAMPAACEVAAVAAQRAFHAPAALRPEHKQAVEALLKQLQGMVDRRKTDRRGMVAIQATGFPIHVSPSSFDRAIRILDSLLTRVASFGGKPSPLMNEHRQPSIGFSFEEFDFHFSIEETSRRVELPRPLRPRRSAENPLLLQYVRNWTMEPTGHLTLSAWGPGSGGYKKVKDGAEQIEARLDQLMSWVFTQTALAKEEARIEAERRNKAVAYLHEKDKPRLAAEFAARSRRQLEVEARNWRRAQNLRQYITAVEAAGQDASRNTHSSKSGFDEWITWAKSQIELLDPISTGEACTMPPEPQPKVYSEIPKIYLEFDDPVEAEKALEREPWRRY
jgi:hypothetical protein